MDFSKILKTHPGFADEFAVHVHDDVVVLGVDNAETAMSREHLKHLPDVAEIDHASAAAGGDIRGEYLHRGIASLNGFSELPAHAGLMLAFHHPEIRLIPLTCPTHIPIPA